MATPLLYNDVPPVLSLQPGDRAAFAAAYNVYYLYIYHFAKKFVEDVQTAEDITADSFVKLWRHAESGTDVQNVKAFLSTTSRNACLKIDSADSIDVEEGDHTTKVSMKLATDKKGLVETRIYTYPETETATVAKKKIRTWTLSADKKILTITDDIEASNGDSYLKVLVYERQ